MADKKKNPKSKKFWIGFLIYICILLVLCIVLYAYTWHAMKKYEASQPETLVSEYIDKLNSGDYSSLTVESAGSRFEPDVDLNADLKNTLSGKKLTYATAGAGTDTMTYYIEDENGEKYGEVTLRATSSRKFYAILSISEWEIESTTAYAEAGDKKTKITIPENYTAYVNGVQLTADEQVGDPTPVDGVEYVAEYVTAPMVVTYEVSGLYNDPVITVNDNSGNPVDMSSYTDYTDINVSYAEQAMPQELIDYSYLVAWSYSNFFSRDLDGCSESTACLQIYFPQGSYYIDLAEQYRTGDMWMYSGHETPVFENIAVSEYIPYNDSCYSVRISFDKSMLLKTGETRTEHNDQTYYFVNIDGSWLVADIRSNE